MGNCCITCFQSSDQNYSTAKTSNEPITIFTNSENRPMNTSNKILNGSITNAKHNSLKQSLVGMINQTSIMSDTITAVNDDFSNDEVSDNTLNLLFEKYKDPDEDAILAEGIEKFCEDLGYQPDEFSILVLAWRLNASEMCRFTKSEFIEGLHFMSADTIEKIRLRLEQITEELRTKADLFKDLYRFTFKFNLEPEQRTLPLDVAIIVWRLVFTIRSTPIIERWLSFLEKHPEIRPIQKDTWNMFLHFVEQFDINKYDDSQAWPCLFDDFVEYEKSTDTNVTNNNMQ